MLTSFVLSMALAAPVPAPAAPVANGPVPKLLEVKANADGKIMVTVMRTEKQKVQVAVGGAVNPNGAPNVVVKELPVTKVATVELGDVKDLTITTADGKKVDVDDAVKKLKDGGVVVISADGKPVSPHHLKLFKDDVLVLASPELVTEPQLRPVRPFPGGVRPPIQIQPLPALPVQPGQVLPANPGGVIQIQIQPGQIQILPAPVPEPQPAKPEPAPQK